MRFQAVHPILALSLVAWLAWGCGNSSRERSTSVSAGSDAAQGTQPAEHEAAYATYQHDEPGDSEATSPEPTGLVPMARSGDPAAPDLDVTTSDTLVYRRDLVDVTARSTHDAVEVVLWDGLGDRQALVYDASASVWRGRYRVPLKTPSDRLGLSVTAKNAEQRWHRVWVFLSIRDERPTPEAGADSVGADRP